MSDPTAAPATIIQCIPVGQIKPSRHQARKDFDEAGIKQLAASIEKEDLLQPITVRKVGEVYELIAGERRLRAVKSLGHPTIDARVIKVVNEAAACAKGLVENLQRQDLNPIEEAEGFRELSSLDPGYWTHDEIAKMAGRSRVYVTQSLGFVKLPAKIQDYVRRLTLNRSQILEIMHLSTPEAQTEAAEKAKDLSWKETRKLVDGMLGPGKKESKKKGSKGKPRQPVQFKLEGDQLSFSGCLPFSPGSGGVNFTTDLFRKLLVAWSGQRDGGDEDPNLLEARKGPAALCAKVLGAEDSRTKLLEGKTWADLGIKTPEDGLKAFMKGDITERGGAMWKK